MRAFKATFPHGLCALFAGFLWSVLPFSAAAQNLDLPAAITDPVKLESTTKADFQQLPLDKLFLTRQLHGASWSPDGRQVVFATNISGRINLWVMPTSGGWPTQLTVSDQRQSSPVWSPDGNWIAYLSDYDGDEMWDIFLVSPKNGQVTNVTLSRNTEEGVPSWSPDSKKLAYSVRPKQKPSSEIDVLDIETHKTTHITTNTRADRENESPIWSHDGKKLAWTQTYSDEKSADVWFADVGTGKTECLTKNSGDQLYSLAAWSPDDRKLLITSNAQNGFSNIAILDLASKSLEWITNDKWEMAAGDFTPDGKRVLYTANVDGSYGVYSYDLATKQTERLPIPDGLNILDTLPGVVSADGSKMLLTHDGPTSPEALWIYDFSSRKAAPLTSSLVGGVHSADLVTPALVHYPSKDGKYQLSAWVYMPYSIKRNAKFPAIVYIHGGPADQATTSFYPLLQYFANQGYIIIAPNYRGSSGYGKAFQDANRMDAGGAELQDVVDAAEFIKKSGFVDPKKLIVMGRSYGGYLTMMAVTKFPDMWAAGVPIVPFVNWFTEFQNEDPTLQEIDRAFMGDPVKNKDLWTERSPYFYLDKVKAPLLVLAGGHDPRCPKTEAQQVADTIRKNGGKVQLKVYEDEGHQFAKIENILDAYQRVSDFLKTYVPSPGCGCSVFEQ